MKDDPFKEYLRQTEPEKQYRGYAWHTAVGLQAVDGLKPSEYLLETAAQNIEGKITIDEAQALLDSYYEESHERDSTRNRTEEADKVSVRIAKLLLENAWYFRNALVRANYNDLRNGIHETTEFLELFLRNLLLDEKNELHNRAMHISGKFAESEKVNIRNEKANIQNKKVNIHKKTVTNVQEIYPNQLRDVSRKTLPHIQCMYDSFCTKVVFGRSDAQRVMGLKPTRTSEILKELADKNVIVPVRGQGKGKYKFVSTEQ